MDSQAGARTELGQEIDQLLSAAMEARPTITEFLHREKERLEFQLDDSHAVKMRESLMRKSIAILGREDVAGRYAKALVWNSPHADMVDALRYRIITSAERYVSTIEAITADLLCSCKAKLVRGWNFWLTDNSFWPSMTRSPFRPRTHQTVGCSLRSNFTPRSRWHAPKEHMTGTITGRTNCPQRRTRNGSNSWKQQLL